MKSLMKFKCVSKSWKSIIKKDAPLLNLHLTHSKAGFLIVAAPPVHPNRLDKGENMRRGYDLSFLSTDLHLNVDNVKRIRSSVKCLGPVRGLLCLVDGFVVQIFNVGTGEVTPCLKLESLEHYTSLDQMELPPRVFSGINLSSDKHKVLCLSWSCKPEVLTLGQDSSAGEIFNVGTTDVTPCLKPKSLEHYTSLDQMELPHQGFLESILVLVNIKFYVCRGCEPEVLTVGENSSAGEVTSWLKPESLEHYTSLDQIELPPWVFFGIDSSFVFYQLEGAPKLCLVDGFVVQIFNVGTGEVTLCLKPERLEHYTSLYQMELPPWFFLESILVL
ncbi:hypothetical protein LINGRAHAP2_LOCUS296, partial [Linum grandiflorum]